MILARHLSFPLTPLAIIALVTGCNGTNEPEGPSACLANPLPSEAVVTIAWRNSTDAMRVLVRGEQKVRAACDFIAGRSNANIPAGPIRATPGPADPAIPFHYVPEEITFVEVAMELCDSKLLRTQSDVAQFFAGTGSSLSGTAPYCPWGARPVAVRQW